MNIRNQPKGPGQVRSRRPALELTRCAAADIVLKDRTTATGGPMAETRTHNFIGGRWKTSPHSAWFDARNPADPREVTGTFPQSSVDDIQEAIESANRAFRHWRDQGLVKRAEYLLRVARLMEEETEVLAR